MHNEHAQQLINKGVQHHQQQDLDAAEHLYRKVLNAFPEQPDAMHLLGVVAKQRRQYVESISLIEQAIELNPNGENSADYHNNCAEAYRANFQYDQAFRHYQQALTLRGCATASLLFNIGGCFQELGRHDEAVPCFDQAIELQPNNSRAYFRRAYSHLTLENFEQGWQDYEWHVQTLTQEHYVRPPWGGPVLPRPSDIEVFHWQESRTLLLYDQGLGDEVCLLRFVPQLEALGTKVTYYAPEKLQPLLNRSGLCEIWNGEDRAFDYIFCVSDLPRLVQMKSLAKLPAPIQLTTHEPIFHDNKQRLRHMPHPWIGLTWRAGLTQQQQSQLKQIPLGELLAQFESCSGTLVLLQRDITAAELKTVNTSALNCINMAAQVDGLEDSLAMMALVDEYVAVANTNVHLRTALGKPSSVLTAANAIDYRWPAGHSSSAWFPGCTAFRQASNGSWNQALRDLARSLAHLETPNYPSADLP